MGLVYRGYGKLRKLKQGGRKGASYKIAPVQWGAYALSVECTVRDANSFVLRLGCLTGESQLMHQWEWEGKWGEERKIILSSKEITP